MTLSETLPHSPPPTDTIILLSKTFESWTRQECRLYFTTVLRYQTNFSFLQVLRLGLWRVRKEDGNIWVAEKEAPVLLD